MRALVLGGYGAVGVALVAALRGEGYEAVTAGRDRTRADRAVDLLEPGLGGYRDALDGVDVVVNAAGVEDPTVVALAAAAGVAFVDITATTGYVAALERLEMPAPVLLSVGLAPGLTNLLAADLHARQRTAGIDLAVLLGAGDAHGAAAEEWSVSLLGRRFRDPATGAAVRNFGSPRTFVLPGYGRRRLYRADFSDQHALTRDLGVPVRTYFGLDSRAATATLALLTRVPAAGRLATGMPLPGSDAWLVLAESADRGSRWAAGRDQSGATATLAAVAARAVLDLPAGVHHLHRALALADLPPGAGIRLGEDV